MHHGNNPIDEETRALFAKQMLESAQQIQTSANKLGLGPTGKFPDGKLADHDEGELQLAVTHYQGKVVINFGKPIAFIGFTAEQADDIADSLKRHAQNIRTAAIIQQ